MRYEAGQLFPVGGIERRLMLPEEAVAEERIASIIEAAQSSDIEAGLAWYQAAHDLCVKLSDKYTAPGFTPEHVAGIIAVLSPLKSWPQNVAQAKELLSTGATRGLGHAVSAAQLIRHSFDPAVIVNRTDENHKVKAFFDNIARPTTSTAVTIDRHMWTLLTGDFDVVKKADLYFKLGEYTWAADRVRAVAQGQGLLPHQTQAIAWIAWRRTQGIVDPPLEDSNQLALAL